MYSGTPCRVRNRSSCILGHHVGKDLEFVYSGTPCGWNLCILRHYGGEVGIHVFWDTMEEV